MEWHDQNNWDADIYPQILTEFLWVLPRTEELTDDDFLELDKKAYEELVALLKINGPGSFGFRHFKNEDDATWDE